MGDAVAGRFKAVAQKASRRPLAMGGLHADLQYAARLCPEKCLAAFATRLAMPFVTQIPPSNIAMGQVDMVHKRAPCAGDAWCRRNG